MASKTKRDAFGKLTATRLKFKGDAAPVSAASVRQKELKKLKKREKKAKKRAKKAKRKLDAVGDQASGDGFVPVQKIGKGRIITSGAFPARVCLAVWHPGSLVDTLSVCVSGTVVTGMDTQFMMELEVGDALVVHHPTRFVIILGCVVYCIGVMFFFSHVCFVSMCAVRAPSGC